MKNTDVIVDSKVNTIADINLGMLLTEREFLSSKLEMTNNAILCVQFLEKYFKVVENKDIVIKIEEKSHDITEEIRKSCEEAGNTTQRGEE